MDYSIHLISIVSSCNKMLHLERNNQNCQIARAWIPFSFFFPVCVNTLILAVEWLMFNCTIYIILFLVIKNICLLLDFRFLKNVIKILHTIFNSFNTYLHSHCAEGLKAWFFMMHTILKKILLISCYSTSLYRVELNTFKLAKTEPIHSKTSISENL